MWLVCGLTYSSIKLQVPLALGFLMFAPCDTLFQESIKLCINFRNSLTTILCAVSRAELLTCEFQSSKTEENTNLKCEFDFLISNFVTSKFALTPFIEHVGELMN